MTSKEKNLGPIQILTGADPLTIDTMRIIKSGAVLCQPGVQSILIRTYKAVSEPVILTKLVIKQNNNQGFSLNIKDESGQFVCDLECKYTGKGFHFRANYRTPEPVWMTEWSLSGLDLDDVIVPALGGQVINHQMPEQTTLSYKYPFWLNAQFILGLKGYHGIMIHSRDDSTDLKVARIRRENSRFTLTYGFESCARRQCTQFSTEWFLEGFYDDWRNPVRDYKNWMIRTFGLTPLNKHKAYPAWAKNINFILELWGARRESQVPHHTFEQMIDRLQAFKQIHNPDETLVYLPGFAEHGIDSHIPDYNPGVILGGGEKFRKLVNTAHKLGYKVMIHTNILGMTYSHNQFRDFKKFQVVDAFNRPQGWGMDIDGDWLTEPYFAYINPGVKKWNLLMEDIIGRLIRDYEIDGVFLDQTLLAFNVRRGPDFIRGMCRHIRHLQKAFPHILFAGEGLHEQILPCLPMAQIHGIDSLCDVHGMEGRLPWRNVHPVSRFLFSGFNRYTAHLLTKHPSNPMFRLQESAYEQLNVIPALCL
ncbi:MAG TPA: hypothetical protein ENO01_03220, partial [Candidatus Marinimicrobia bacterium]|nr:hypothetical protein [Candidatus Neomarinimicrobiota bacterium]